MITTPRKGHGGWYGESERHARAARGIKTKGPTYRNRRTAGKQSSTSMVTRLREHKEIRQSSLSLRADIVFEGIRWMGELMLGSDELDPRVRPLVLGIKTLTGIEQTTPENIEWITKDAVKIVRIAVTSPKDQQSIRKIAARLIEVGVCLAIPEARKAARPVTAWLEGNRTAQGVALELCIALFDNVLE